MRSILALFLTTASLFSAQAAPLSLTPIARISRSDLPPDQQTAPLMLTDPQLASPKAAQFSPDGKKLYVNALEAHRTLIYEWPSLKKIKSIFHRFVQNNVDLFQGLTEVFDYRFPTTVSEPNTFLGKPVEMTFSHGGRYLWIPYYRRSYDEGSVYPSAVAIIDTDIDEIVRVIPTGPIPKIVAISPNGDWAAISHWGDNSVMLLDISSSQPERFEIVRNMVVENRLNLENLGVVDRDKVCGFCLRGVVFTPDSRYLLVARMGGGGFAGFDVRSGEYLGSIMNLPATPRDLVITPNKKDLVVSCHQSGLLARAPVEDVVNSLLLAKGRHVRGPDFRTVSTGGGARTVDLSRDGRYAFVAANTASLLTVINMETWQPEASISTYPFPVGLALHPKDNVVVVTSQGKNGVGGHTLDFFEWEPVRKKWFKLW